LPSTENRLASALSDRYRIERELGQGGMATVYRAEDLKHGRKVAIKVLHPELSAVIGGDRFLAEIKVTASLQHPHILGLIDSGAVPLDSGLSTPDASDDSRLSTDLLYRVMPYVSGPMARASSWSGSVVRRSSPTCRTGPHSSRARPQLARHECQPEQRCHPERSEGST
jgi:eukaryotic-like serine/threonine-protein kinase